MARSRLSIDRGALEDFCRRHHVRRLSLFGSVLTDRFRADSDVDVLVAFEAGQTPSLVGMAALELELSALVGRKVDLRTASELSRYFRGEVLRESELQYAQG